MIELYHCVDARSFRALWALEELGLDYRLHMLPFPPRVLQPEYLEINPLGTIPLLLDGEVRMTESAAIPQYLATRYGPTPLAVEPHEPDYALWLDWMHRSEATLTFPQTIVLRYSRLEPEERRLQQASDDYTQWFLSRLRHLTRALSDREWLCGGRFTMADLCVGYALIFARLLNLEHRFSPEIEAYWERLRPALPSLLPRPRRTLACPLRSQPFLKTASPLHDRRFTDADPQPCLCPPSAGHAVDRLYVQLSGSPDSGHSGSGH